MKNSLPLKFAPAKAILSGKDSVTLESDDVAHPVFVRYAWSNTPSVSLFNSEGRPAIPFATEWNASHGLVLNLKDIVRP